MICSCGSQKIHNHRRKFARYFLRHWDEADQKERTKLLRRARDTGYKYGGVQDRLLEQLRKDAA